MSLLPPGEPVLSLLSSSKDEGGHGEGRGAPRAPAFTPPHRLDLDRLGPGLWEKTEEGPVFALDRGDAGEDLDPHPAAALDATWRSLSLLMSRPGEGPERLARAAFLDTETTGLAGGTGTYAFLVGIAYFEEGEVRLRQYLLDSPAREGAMLRALARFLSRFEALVTYNGASFDLPLLETRYITSRMRSPTLALPHLDLLHPARRLYRGRLRSCRLQELERALLGLMRRDDVPGFEVPGRYFQYLRTGRLEPLRDVLAHNAQDVVSLMSVAAYFARLVEEGPRDGRDALALARIHERARRYTTAAAAYDRALAVWQLELHEQREARRRMAHAHRRAGDWDAAAATWRQAIADGEPFSIAPHVELAKYHERHRGDAATALEYTRSALAVVDRATRIAPIWAAAQQEALARRVARLERRIARLAPG